MQCRKLGEFSGGGERSAGMDVRKEEPTIMVLVAETVPPVAVHLHSLAEEISLFPCSRTALGQG